MMGTDTQAFDEIIDALNLDQLYACRALLDARIAKLEGEGPLAPGTSSREVVETTRKGRYTYQLEYVVCGKENCRCARGIKHGPYYYRYWRSGGKLHREYVGKQRPLDDSITDTP